MNRTTVTFAAIATSLGVALSAAAFSQGVTVRVGEPGFYGRLDIGDAPRPALVTPSPVIVEREHVVQEPTYVYVPTEQQHDWANYCGRYDACSRPVYFVQEQWYKDVYVPQYKSRHEIREEKRDAKRDYKDAKRDAKRDYKDDKRDARDPN